MKEGAIVRLGLIGCGGFSETLAQAVKNSKNAKLITCFDINSERRRKIGEKFGCDQEASYEDVLKRDDIDGVLLVTPNSVHADNAVLSAQHGNTFSLRSLSPIQLPTEKK